MRHLTPQLHSPNAAARSSLFPELRFSFAYFASPSRSLRKGSPRRVNQNLSNAIVDDMPSPLGRISAQKLPSATHYKYLIVHPGVGHVCGPTILVCFRVRNIRRESYPRTDPHY